MERFIKAIRNHECLWDVNNRDYRNQDKKDAAWRSIVLMRCAPIRSISEAKAEWKKLRDNHRESLKRRKASNSTTHTWRYAEEMEFLLPFMKNRKKKGMSPIDGESPQYLDLDDDFNEYYTEQPLHSATDEAFNYTTMEGVEVSYDAPEPSKTNVDGDLVDLLKEIKDTQKRRQEERQAIAELKEKHPIDKFLDSMAMSIKEMPKWMQIKVKRKIFAIVSEAEDELEYNVPDAKKRCNKDNVDADAGGVSNSTD